MRVIGKLNIGYDYFSIVSSTLSISCLGTRPDLAHQRTPRLAAATRLSDQPRTLQR